MINNFQYSRNISVYYLSFTKNKMLLNHATQCHATQHNTTHAMQRHAMQRNSILDTLRHVTPHMPYNATPRNANATQHHTCHATPRNANSTQRNATSHMPRLGHRYKMLVCGHTTQILNSGWVSKRF